MIYTGWGFHIAETIRKCPNCLVLADMILELSKDLIDLRKDKKELEKSQGITWTLPKSFIDNEMIDWVPSMCASCQRGYTDGSCDCT